MLFKGYVKIEKLIFKVNIDKNMYSICNISVKLIVQIVFDTNVYVS